MDKNMYLIGSEGVCLKFVEVDAEKKSCKPYRIPAQNFAGREYECANFEISKLSYGRLNGKSFACLNELVDRVSKTNGKWFIAKKVTDSSNNVIGYGIIENGTYKNVTKEAALARADKCANAFVRDGVLINKDRETEELPASNTIKEKEYLIEKGKPINSISEAVNKQMNEERKMADTAKQVVAGSKDRVPVLVDADNGMPLHTDAGKVDLDRVNVTSNIRIETPEVLANVAAKTAEQNRSVDDITRMKEIVEKLNAAREVYEQGEDEIMSNYEYDALYDNLMVLEGKTGTILANSPTQKVGYEVVSNLPKEQHASAMLSLAKTKDIADLRAFLGTKSGELSWKLDGITIVLTYRNGELAKAVTRGNGYVGELVTNNAKTFINLPKRISRQDEIVLRAEALISYEDFEKIKATPEGADYKNSRNLCSGSVRQLDSSVTAKRNVRAVVFEWVNAPDTLSKKEQLDFCKNLGFEVVQSVTVNYENIASAIKGFEMYIPKFQYPSDGLVLTYEDIKYGRSLGNTAKTPKHSIAFKWQDETAETELVDIEWTVGRSGIITPTAVFKPVELEGTTVQKASMHNLSIMTELLGEHPYVGQKIWVYKANMIIPQISRAEKS